jgi:hypothetical protein
MEMTDDILNCVRNIRYETDRIQKYCQEQVESDLKKYEMSEPNGSSRLTVIGIISGCVPQIENWLTNIEINLENADKLIPPRKETLSERLL